MASTLPAAAVEEKPLPAGGVDLVAASPPAADTFATFSTPAEAEVVAVEGMPFQRALRVTVEREPEDAWRVQVKLPFERAVRQGDAVLVSFWMRTLGSDDESGDGRVTALVKQTVGEKKKRLAEVLGTAGGQWRRIDRAFTLPQGLAAGEAELSIWLGYRPQTVELGPVRVVNYGDEVEAKDLPRSRITYTGREPDAAWRAEAERRIERHRKADLTVRVVDAAGRPVPGAKVHVEQRRHAFGFGTAATAKGLAADTPEDRRYREIIEQNFNKVGFENDLKWKQWLVAADGQHRNYRRAYLDAALRWLDERDIETHGHYLLWAPLGRGQPEQFRDVSREQLRQATLDHAREKLAWTHAPGHEYRRLDEWDALNHVVGWGETYADRLGGPDIYAQVIKLGRELAPDAQMWVNEGQVLPGGGRREAYLDIIGKLIERDATPDGAGFMAHFREASLTPIPELYEVIDRFAKRYPEVRLQLTELDVDVGTDEQLQADYLRDALTIAFSHPQVDAIVQWGFWEGRHWRPDAALWRRDWSIKPSGEAYRDLVFDRWWTDETLTTDDEGAATTRAFPGRHGVRVEAKGRTLERVVELGPDGETLTLRLMER